MTREHAPKPGTHWQTEVQRVETVVPDDTEPPRPNRKTRRDKARASRKRSKQRGTDTP